ncbi:hypothetical protein GCM10008935_26350 [Alkalibacillus silvisoli]|uniref:Uncharacterized protein n=1 Tax=Alkalibacillus silvisoli TaxID=392823 RepID=A0ABN1A784_9BACI
MKQTKVIIIIIMGIKVGKSHRGVTLWGFSFIWLCVGVGVSADKLVLSADKWVLSADKSTASADKWSPSADKSTASADKWGPSAVKSTANADKSR